MIRIWLKHRLAESVLDTFFDTVFNNFNVHQLGESVMFLSETTEAHYNKPIRKVYCDDQLYECGEKCSPQTRIIRMWVIDVYNIGVIYVVDEDYEHVHNEIMFTDNARIYF